jgi:hypothetical protein
MSNAFLLPADGYKYLNGRWFNIILVFALRFLTYLLSSSPDSAILEKCVLATPPVPPNLITPSSYRTSSHLFFTFNV